MKLYFVTVMTHKPGWGSERSRCWGFYQSQYEAEKALMSSPSFLSEDMYYTHAVIECLDEGMTTYDLNPLWFEFKFLGDHSELVRDEDGDWMRTWMEIEVKRIDKPEWSKNIVGWGIG